MRGQLVLYVYQLGLKVVNHHLLGLELPITKLLNQSSSTLSELLEILGSHLQL